MMIGKILRLANIDRLDAEVLLAHVLGKPRGWLHAHDANELTAGQQKMFDACVSRRKNDEPVALITGVQEFYGREFFVTRDTLIPRPATEALIDCVKKTCVDDQPHAIDADTNIVCGSILWKSMRDVQTMIDVGTGSGCIAITLALELPKYNFVATDSSIEALKIAQKNRDVYELHDRITLHHANILDDIPAETEDHDPPPRKIVIDRSFMIVSNPPYIPEHIVLQKSVNDYEPHSAVFAGPDGLDVINTLMTSARSHPLCVGIALECRAEQWRLVASQK